MQRLSSESRDGGRISLRPLPSAATGEQWGAAHAAVRTRAPYPPLCRNWSWKSGALAGHQRGCREGSFVDESNAPNPNRSTLFTIIFHPACSCSLKKLRHRWAWLRGGTVEREPENWSAPLSKGCLTTLSQGDCRPTNAPLRKGGCLTGHLDSMSRPVI